MLQAIRQFVWSRSGASLHRIDHYVFSQQVSLLEKDVKQPSAVDVYVGERVRVRRKMLGLSQEALAKQLEVSFQQVQKYERGHNRISASKLYDIAQALQVPVASFFDGFTEDDSSTVETVTDRAAQGFLATAEGVQLALAFPRLKIAKQRRSVLDLVRSLADD